MSDESTILDSGMLQAIGALLAVAVAWWFGRKSAERDERVFQTQVPRENIKEAHQPLFAAVTKIDDALKDYKEGVDKPLRNTCLDYIKTWSRLQADGARIFLDADTAEAAVSLRKFIERSLATEETKVHCTIVGPGFNSSSDPELVVGNKADRLFGLPPLDTRPHSPFNLVVTEVVCAAPNSEAFRWQLQRIVPKVCDMLHSVVHSS